MEDEFKKLGIQLVSVSYDDVKTLKAFIEKGTGEKKVKFPLLSDPKSELIRALSIFNEKVKKGHKWYGVPHPHVFLVNTEG